jgi:tRNA dimethylallyltransferase
VTKALSPVFAALPVVTSTNHGIASAATTFPSSEMEFAATSANSGKREGARPYSSGVERIVIGIFGPTASGKTAVAEAIAAREPAEIVSADAMQVYRGLEILTNQSERPARLVAIWPLDHEASVGEYATLAHAAIDEALAAGRRPVVVGGTGLYLRAALAELELPPAPAPGVRLRIAQLYDRQGAERAHALLAERDPAAAAAVHPNDRRRVVRALELAEAGTSLRPPRDRLWAGETRHPTLVVGLDVPAEDLARRIHERTRAMFERGVEQEVQRALAGPLSTTARTVIGLPEIAELPRTEAIEALAQRTRRYAAYQRKWMRRVAGLVTVRADRSPEEIADEILDMAGARERLPRHAAAPRR